MIEHLPYFALFYVLGMLLMALFIRFYLRKKRQDKFRKDNHQ